MDPARDITVIPDLRGHPMDPTGREIGLPGQPSWQRLGSKVLIDATRPPLNDPDTRAHFERIKPPGHGRVRREDFLSGDGLLSRAPPRSRRRARG